jgi:NADPH-dependent 2,4-dienoyl-CoA reductase/sulfur reductase-like enzyme
MSETETLLIVGSGLAGVTAAGALREGGFSGRLVLLGTEPETPYDRPPLSKSVLVHDEFETLVSEHLPQDIALRSPAQIALRPADWYVERKIELLLGRTAVRLDPAAHVVQTDGGEELRYDRLLLATGAGVRRLPGLERGPVPTLYLRTLRDALTLRNHLRPGRRVVLIGGGVIGMEVAASAVLRECDVTVVEVADRIMARALCRDISEHLETYHRSKGVKILLSISAESQSAMPASSAASGADLEPSSGGVRLQNGSVIPAELIVVGIGVLPNTQLAQSAGLTCGNGIKVDEYGRTSGPDIFAAGDAVEYPDVFLGRTIRSENWMHAQNQALAVARNMLGAHEPYYQVPHMWSDQYDLKIQTSGRCESGESVLRGERARNKFMLFHLSDGRLAGATGINEARDMKFAQRLIEARARIEPAKLSDPTFNLKKAASG